MMATCTHKMQPVQAIEFAWTFCKAVDKWVLRDAETPQNFQTRSQTSYILTKCDILFKMKGCIYVGTWVIILGTFLHKD